MKNNRYDFNIGISLIFLEFFNEIRQKFYKIAFLAIFFGLKMPS